MKYLEAVRYLTEQNIIKPDAEWDIKENKERRSLDANAYFHTLADKLRFKIDPMPWSMAHIKNHLITSYGQVERDDDGNIVYIKANIPAEKMQEVEYLHCLPVKYESDTVVIYRVYRGSHTYNSKEMSQLIAGTVDECQRLGITTATPTELARMAELWRAKHG
jgi:hypothetical protein